MSDSEPTADKLLLEASSAAASGVVMDPAHTLVIDPRVYIADLDPAAALTKMMANHWADLLGRAGGMGGPAC